MMTPLAALGDGIRRVNRAPAIVCGVFVLTMFISLPLALALKGMIAQHLGSSLAADTAASGVNYQWWQEFSDQATGLGVSFRPTIIGFGAVLDNLSSFLDNVHHPVVLVGAGSAYVVLWLFMAGGILDRYARDRATRSYGFFAASGVFFFRFLRLAVVMWLVYGFLFGFVHTWLLTDLYSRLTRNLTVERTAFLLTVVLYVVFGLLVAACNAIFDYAKVRAVVEDRRSMLGAIRSAIGFIKRNLPAVATLYLADFGLFVLVLALYALVAPNAGGAGWSVWIAFAIGQLYVLGRLCVKLLFWASEVALFQGRLAHAGYVAAPTPIWPESPAAEAIGR